MPRCRRSALADQRLWTALSSCSGRSSSGRSSRRPAKRTGKPARSSLPARAFRRLRGFCGSGEAEAPRGEHPEQIDVCMRVAGALFESLMEVVCPPKPEPSYLLVLEKAPTQEEFIRGYMNGNPYSSEEVGPLMRDVKNMICETLDMAGLVEDDYGMELLVAGRIISLSLPIRTVYERVWRANLISGQQGGGRLAEGSAEGPPMLVTYRLQGLDGEATEPMVSELEDVSAEDSSPEEEFRAATVLAEALSGGTPARHLGFPSSSSRSRCCLPTPRSPRCPGWGALVPSRPSRCGRGSSSPASCTLPCTSGLAGRPPSARAPSQSC
uniref:E3 ubiquitin-protein ligase UBR4 n=1 Tax=Tetraselmis sp. GSL018 TaxID=582737 RepID=A0A061SA67_9CHLO